MNRVVLFKHDLNQDRTFSIRDRERIDHIQNHIKAKAGDELKITIIDQGLANATIIHLAKDEIRLQIKVDQGLEAPTQPQVSLFVATSRPPTLKKVVEHGTTLGVSHFHFFSAKLSEKSYLQSKVLKEDKLRELAMLGVSQSGRLWKMPTFAFSHHLEESFSKADGDKFILSLSKGETLLNKRVDLQGPTSFFIGPERGWTTQEEAFLFENGVQPIVLSKHILRVETAAFALLSQLEMLRLS